MKTRMKKLVMVLLCVSVWAMNFAAMGECTDKSIYEPISETEDFTYEIVGKEEGKQYIEIMELTKVGETKEVLVVPKTIDGIPVTRLHRNTLVFGDIVTWETKKLTALYLPSNLYVDAEFLCPNLTKSFIIEGGERLSVNNMTLAAKVSPVYFNAENFFLWGDHRPTTGRPANVTYRYNYDDSPNRGCYWLDNLGDGEKITYIPEKPTREGYKFDGWYKEAECITEWDFENDTATVYEYEEYTQETFYENVLYAKWLEI